MPGVPLITQLELSPPSFHSPQTYPTHSAARHPLGQFLLEYKLTIWKPPVISSFCQTRVNNICSISHNLTPLIVIAPDRHLLFKLNILEQDQKVSEADPQTTKR